MFDFKHAHANPYAFDPKCRDMQSLRSAEQDVMKQVSPHFVAIACNAHVTWEALLCTIIATRLATHAGVPRSCFPNSGATPVSAPLSLHS